MKKEWRHYTRFSMVKKENKHGNLYFLNGNMVTSETTVSEFKGDSVSTRLWHMCLRHMSIGEQENCRRKEYLGREILWSWSSMNIMGSKSKL